jgi:hypothetical protein
MDKTNDRLVAFIDILGFKNAVDNSSPDQILNMFIRLIYSILFAHFREISSKLREKTADFFNENNNNKNSINEIEVFEQKTELFLQSMKIISNTIDEKSYTKSIEAKQKCDNAIQNIFPFGYRIISDSIIVFSEQLENESNHIDTFANFISFIRRIYSESAKMSLCLRGGISKGQFYFDEGNQIMFGKALNRAVEIEKTQNWIGCMLDQNLKTLADTYTSSLSPFKRHHIINWYDVPLHDEQTVAAYIINWYSALYPGLKPNKDVFNEFLTGNSKIDKKYSNTIEYMNRWADYAKRLFGFKMD